MGLCKCPKRKTTSHFCFHHCVNVCEHCIVNNHTTCVVKSYTTWLKEASSTSSSVSASALCAVCQKQFVLTPKEIENFTTNFNGFGSDAKTAIRLLCYHIVHARCLSVYVKKQIKEGNILKCPSCARPLWLKQQEQIQDSVDNTDDPNELSPVESHLYKHLLDHGNWWGQALITNKNMKDIENYLLEDEDDYEETADEESQKLLEDQSTLEFKPQFNVVSNNISPLTLAQTIQSTSSDNSYYNNYNNSESVHKKPDVTTISYRSNTHQTYQPIHHRQFNNNYGIDTVFAPLPQQPQQNLQQQQCLSVNITTAQGSDLSNRHTVTSCPPLLLNDDNNLNHDEEQLDPSSKYRPKKFNNQSWSLSYQRLIQYFCGTNNRAEDNNTTKIAAIIILCVIFIVVLLVAITSYTRSINEPFDNNSIDYAGDDQVNNGGPAAHLKSFNINNL